MKASTWGIPLRYYGAMENREAIMSDLLVESSGLRRPTPAIETSDGFTLGKDVSTMVAALPQSQLPAKR